MNYLELLMQPEVIPGLFNFYVKALQHNLGSSAPAVFELVASLRSLGR